MLESTASAASGATSCARALHDKDLEFVAVNDITDAPTLAHLLKYDSILGNLPDDVKAEGDTITWSPAARSRSSP